MEETFLARPETRLLLEAVRPPTPDDLQGILAFAQSQGIDWENFYTLAETHRVIPTVAYALSKHAGGAIPADVQGRFAQAAQVYAYRGIWYDGNLARVLAALTAAGIPAVPLKGPALARWLYRHVGGRQFIDLDVIVPEPMLPQAMEVMESLGYGSHPLHYLIHPAEVDYAKEHFELGHISYQHTENGILLDLHWQATIYGAAPNLTEALLSGSSDQTLSGAPGPAGTNVVAMATFVLEHGARHGYRRLSWLVDAAMLITRLSDDEWESVLNLARADDLERSVLLGPAIVQRLLNLPLPAPLQAPVARQGRQLHRLTQWCLAHLLEENQAPIVPFSHVLSGVVYELALMSSHRKRAHRLSKMLLFGTNPDVNAATLARGWRGSLARMAVRPGVRMLLKAGQKLWPR